MNYRPLPDEVTIKESDIEGWGLFSTCAIERGTNLGMTHYKAPELENGWCRTPLGGFINHSEEPNCYIATDKGDRILHTIKPIKAGEELTVYYRFKGYDGIIGSDTDVEIEE